MNHLKDLVTLYPLIGIGSPRASVESNFALMQLVGKENFYQGVSGDTAYLEGRMTDLLQQGTVHSVSLKEIESADAVLVLGEDIWHTAPVMALAVRQSVMKTAAAQATQQNSLAAWHDAAIKELVQEQKGFLANITILSSPLDSISTIAMRNNPDNIARLGFAIAHLLNAGIPAVTSLTEKEMHAAKHIADALLHAQRPVVITGNSCCNEALVKAAFNIVQSLSTPQRKAGISFVFPECNSMGAALMRASSFEAAAERVRTDNNCTAIVLENDLYRHVPAAKADAFLSQCKNLVVMDGLHNRTTEKAHVLIPAATFAEADGTLVNNEGRAQHFYQVFMPVNTHIKESWRWLGEMKTMQAKASNGLQQHPDEWLAKLEITLPQFASIAKVMPPRHFRINGQAIPREPHRYSGRTAMYANLGVSEPKPLQDDDSPLTYTMEGYAGIPPSSMIPYFWAPGWNSGQAVNKYQHEIGAALREENSGICLFASKTGALQFFKDSPEAFVPRPGKHLLLPQYQLFGSGEWSMYSEAISELVPEAAIILSKKDAADLGAVNGTLIIIEKNDFQYRLPLVIHDELCSGIVLASAGFHGMPALPWGSWVKLNV